MKKINKAFRKKEVKKRENYVNFGFVFNLIQLQWDVY